ncbi:hypothetical protein EX895_006330 [Sporisorium graminicola]|uniref:Ketoreductase (KR) domain-containing protein n=1 Tax=Sporisorium graminicola TaxID=280036 RepID=A0A4U7KLY6_9BASI|nr:hypothetical protein EX895_006330 [Sporisorium graminicola]TKY85250.1 hypothetical protein EX895_006330 [Sporisorium graminicola]
MASYASILRDMLRPTSTPAPHWDPTTSMPLLADRIVILTGPTSGIGYETLRQLILSSAHVYLFGRSLPRLQHTRDTIAAECAAALTACPPESPRHGAQPGRMSLVECDLSDLLSIQKAAKEFLEREQKVDLVFGNAGVMVAGETVQGYEMMFGTNVLGHHALLRLLLPALQRSASDRNSTTTGETRIILTASNTHHWVDHPSHLDLSPDATNPTLGHIHLYGRSKLGNIYTTAHLARLSTTHRWGMTICSVHPGGVKSQLGSRNRLLTSIKNLFLVPATLGAVTQLWGGTAADSNEVHGRFLVPYARVGTESELARNLDVERNVWAWCEQQCVKHGLINEHEVMA